MATADGVVLAAGAVGGAAGCAGGAGTDSRDGDDPTPDAPGTLGAEVGPDDGTAVGDAVSDSD